MAATTLNMFKRCLFFTIELSLIISSMSQITTESTTAPSTLDTANTTAATTISTTTTVTTTTIRPTVPATNIPQNTDISKCPCDLTGNACDVNCCCDPECSDADKAVFSECLPNSYVLDDKLCFNKDVFLFENGPAASGESNDLFCIYFDNDQQRNYYSNPVLVTSPAEFLRYASTYGKFSFQNPAATQSTSQFNNYYKSGDPIYVVYPNDAFSYLGLPASLNTGLCVDSNPAAYLIDQSSQCSRVLNIQSSCENNSALKAKTYYTGFRIVKDPFLLKGFNSTININDSVIGTPDLSSVTNLYNNSFTSDIELDPMNPIQCINEYGIKGLCSFNISDNTTYYNSSICYNAVSEVNYRFETNGTLGLQKAYVSFVFRNINVLNLAQTFSTSFTKTAASTQDPLYRSGNPGYQIGQPVIAGILNVTVQGTTTVEKILLLKARGQQLTLIRSSLNGDCASDANVDREPVIFGQDMRTGCFININSTNDNSICQKLQQLIINAIEGDAAPTFEPTFGSYPKNNRYVAMFGNSDVLKTGDWVEILYRNRPIPPTTIGTQCSLSLGANIQILYAKIGALPNPQPKIIGVSFVYDDIQSVAYKCSGPYCQPGSSTLSQKLEITSSITFIDVSLSPQGVEGKYPTVAVRLPYDFFYPFLSSSAQQRHCIFMSQLLSFVCIMYILLVTLY